MRYMHYYHMRYEVFNCSALNWGTRVTLQDWALWVSHRPAFDVSVVNHGVVRCRSGWRGIDEGAEGCRRHCEMRKKS